MDHKIKKSLHDLFCIFHQVVDSFATAGFVGGVYNAAWRKCLDQHNEGVVISTVSEVAEMEAAPPGPEP